MTTSKQIDRTSIKKTFPAVVQIVALRQAFMGNLSSAWTGSGTIVDQKGLVLTNCHVANPRAMGMPAPPADKLAIAVIERSDEPPVLTYFAEIVTQSPKLDLAVLKITGRLDGKSISRLNLPVVPIGNSDSLELGDDLSIFGFPGIGGETITFTSGNVSGFTSQKDLTSGRAWIKTDATIAGGNSGGTAIDNSGVLVGIPTQAAAGTGISPVDARPVVDTNLDGRIDQRDTPMAVGGFINGLRPVNLAKPLLKKAGITTTTGKVPSSHKRGESLKSKPGTTSRKKTTSTTRKSSKTKSPKISNLVFSDNVTKDGRPINPNAILSGKRKKVFASFEYDNFRNGLTWQQTWAVNGKTVFEDDGKWEDGPRGRKTLALASRKELPQGQFHLIVTVSRKILAEGQVVVGHSAGDRDTQISGQVIDRSSKKGVSGSLVIVLKPNVKTQDFIRLKKKDMAFTSTKSDKNGRFTFPKQLPKGQAYSLIVVAKGYRDMAIEGALRISPHAPEKAQIYPIQMIRG